MTEEGRVVKLDGKTAIARIERKSICDSCDHKCGMTRGAKFNDVHLLNEVGAKIGDVVEIEFADVGIMKFVGAVYLIPLVLSAIGLFVAISIGLSELVQLLICVASLLVSAIITYLIDKAYKKKQLAPKITKIIKSEEGQ